MKRVFVAYFFFINWSSLSLGLHIDITLPNLEIHLPFGFIRIGWKKTNSILAKNQYEVDKQVFGWNPR